MHASEESIDFDCIVVGAGPAGLSIASELAKNHSLLLLEKNVIGATHKTWTTEAAIVHKAGLGHCISAKFDSCFLETTDGRRAHFYDRIVSLDENKVLLHFIKKVEAQGGRLLSHCTLYRTVRSDSHITLETSKGTFRPRLLVDCTGIESPLMTQQSIIRNAFYCSIYGEVLTADKRYRLASLKDSHVLGKVVRKDTPLTFYEVFPASTKDNTVVFYTFQYSTQKRDPKNLQKLHEVGKRIYMQANTIPRLHVTKEVYGVVPLGSVKKTAVDRIYFFGDTDLHAAPLVASGFTSILLTFRRCAAHLSRCLKEDTLDEKHLSVPHSWREELNRDFQTLFGLMFTRATPEQYDHLVVLVSGIPNKTLLDLIFMRLTPNEIALIVRNMLQHASLKDLISLFPKEEYITLLEKTGEVIVDDIMEAVTRA